MKRVLLSILVIGIVSIGAFAATRAYFSDQETVLGNRVETGVLSITNSSYSWQVPVSLLNAKPGDTFRKWVRIENGGTLDVGSLTVSAINPVGDVDFLQYINVSLYGQVNGYEQGIYSPNWSVGQPVNPWLNNINVLGTAVYRDATAAHLLKPGEVDTIILDFKIPTALGNEFQGKSVTFDLYFYAEQVH